jgi:ubiquinone biosynthesis protein
VNFHFIRDAVRAKEIVGTLLRYRFDKLLEQTDTPASWLSRLTPPVREGIPPERRVRLACEELGPTFIKIGQILSTRPDILPREFIEELGLLRDRITPLPFSRVCTVLQKELGAPLESVFSRFDEVAVTSGSLGQIHRACLKSSGKEVAVKVQKPDLRTPIQTDIEIITWLVTQVHDNVPEWRAFDLPAVVEELRKGLLDELDFTIEARNAAVFNALNQFPEKVFAPTPVDELTTPRLLVYEWVEGTPPRSAAELSPEKRKAVALAGGHSFFSQIVLTGFFHGDPHPGNLLLTADNRVCFLDWGLAGQLTKRMRYALIDLFSACSKRDAEMVTRIALGLGRPALRIDRQSLEKAITTVLFKYEKDLRSMDRIGSVIFELIFVFGSHGIHVTRDYTLLAKAVVSIEETATQLDPQFTLGSVGKPYVQRLNWERWNPGNMARSFASDARERLSQIADLPRDVQRILHRLEDGDLPIRLEHRGVDRATNTIHHAFSRLSLAVIIGSLIIGSSLVINTGTRPLLWGYPALGILGYLLSATIGAYVAFDILRSGRSTKPR